MRVATGHRPGPATPLAVRQVTPLNSHPAALPGQLHGYRFDMPSCGRLSSPARRSLPDPTSPVGRMAPQCQPLTSRSPPRGRRKRCRLQVSWCSTCDAMSSRLALAKPVYEPVAGGHSPRSDGLLSRTPQTINEAQLWRKISELQDKNTEQRERASSVGPLCLHIHTRTSQHHLFTRALRCSAG